MCHLSKVPGNHITGLPQLCPLNLVDGIVQNPLIVMVARRVLALFKLLITPRNCNYGPTSIVTVHPLSIPVSVQQKQICLCKYLQQPTEKTGLFGNDNHLLIVEFNNLALIHNKSQWVFFPEYKII